MDANVSVLIVNWNGQSLLEPCFEALKAQTYPPHEVIVVDNGSHDDSVSFLKQYDWPLLKTCFLSENTGFSGGNNAGLPLVTGNVIALLNNDTLVEPDWIAQAIPHFQDEKVGMVACKSIRLHAENQLDKVGHLIFPDGLNRGRGTGLPVSQFSEVEEVLWPDGGAGFYRKSMIDEIGFFDHDFFLYGEDAELGMRARWAGYICIYEPKSSLKHHHSASMGKSSPQKVYYIERNRIWVLVKTFPWTWILLSPIYSVARYFMNVVSLFSGKGAAADFQEQQSGVVLALKLLHALWDGCLGIPKMLAKRKTYPRRISNAAMIQILKKYRISTKEITLQD